MNRHKVVLFMKGNPSAPKCGFSRQIVGLLRDRGVEFAWYDILSDQAVREELKKMNDWPSECSVRFSRISSTRGAHFPGGTYGSLLIFLPLYVSAFPQVILNGELIGGLDIFKDSLESGEWDEMYESTE